MPLEYDNEPGSWGVLRFTGLLMFALMRSTHNVSS